MMKSLCPAGGTQTSTHFSLFSCWYYRTTGPCDPWSLLCVVALRCLPTQDRPLPMKSYKMSSLIRLDKQHWSHIGHGQSSILTSSPATGLFCHFLPIFSYLLLKSPWSSFPHFGPFPKHFIKSLKQSKDSHTSRNDSNVLLRVSRCLLWPRDPLPLTCLVSFALGNEANPPSLTGLGPGQGVYTD